MPPIKIIPAGEVIPVDTIITLILGNPGVGKTSLANTAENMLLLDFDGGSHRSISRKDVIRINRWDDVEELDESHLSAYKTLGIDTIGRCIDIMIDDIIRTDAKLASSGQLSQRGYGILKGRFRTWLNRMRSFGLNIVMVAHAIEDRQGDEVKLRIDCQGSSKEEVYKVSDLMGRFLIENKRPVIDWDPSETGFGKNPAGLPRGPVPTAYKTPDYLQKCLRITIDHLGQKNSDDVDEEKRLGELRTLFEETGGGAEELTHIARTMRESGAKNADKQILASVAKERGYELDKKTLTFTDPKAAAEDVPGDESEQQSDAF